MIGVERMSVISLDCLIFIFEFSIGELIFNYISK